MKLLAFIIVCLAPTLVFSQSTRAYESAKYEVTNNGASAFYTDLHCSSAPFNKSQFQSFQEIAMEKEGVFEVQIRDNGKTIRVAHLSFVEGETLKHFGQTICDGIEVEEPQAYTF